MLIASAIFGLNFFQDDIKSFFYNSSAFSQGILWNIGENASDFFASVFNVENLRKEKEQLSCNNQELLAKIVILEDLKKENDELRNALGLGLEKEYNLLLAQIIGKDISQDFLTINRGFADGVSKNMPVVTGHKVLVGKISEVYKNYSKVMLISNKKVSFDATILKKDISGVVKGLGGFKILFDLLPQDKEISKDDIVISSSFGGIFPKDFLVGMVINIKKNDIDSFQQAELSLSFDINTSSEVFVITNFNI